jgi:hypothetical protein
MSTTHTQTDSAEGHRLAGSAQSPQPTATRHSISLTHQYQLVASEWAQAAQGVP